MPSTSAKQAKFMRAVAHSPKFAKKVGVSQSVGKDFSEADKKMHKFKRGGATPAPKPPLKPAPGTNDPDYQDEGVMKEKPKPKPKPVLKPAGQAGYAAGGTTKEMPSSKSMGSLGMAKGGGIERKGKTKGTMIKMAKGGSIDGVAQRGKTRCKGAK